MFAKRISDGLLLCEEMEFLVTEVRHLNALVTSCQSDSRFSQVEFCRLHSHLGRLVAARLDSSELPRILDCLRSLVNRSVCSLPYFAFSFHLVCILNIASLVSHFLYIISKFKHKFCAIQCRFYFWHNFCVCVDGKMILT